MIATGVLTPHAAADALDAMRAKNDRLPRNECNQRSKEWRQ
ncbi:MAG: hypothetical protein J7M19_03075 [Planctomycetes bacterium]|nr:hypothetical protein [Planctomycetota bacterium]